MAAISREEENVITVRIGEIKTATIPFVLSSVGLGSCVAVFIRDAKKAVGGMAHALLPWRPRDVQGGTNLCKYADYAIEKMVEEIINLGGSHNRLQAKVAGCAHMFDSSKGEFPINVGQRNLEAVKRKLSEMNIPIVSEDTGGSHGRSIEASLETGKVKVRSLRKGSVVI